jgi:hypothetical protein
MATLSVGGQLVATNDTLSNGVQDNITRLGTVTTGTMNNTIGSSATFPAGHQVKRSVIHRRNQPSIISFTTTSFTDSGLEISHETMYSSAESYLVYDFYHGMANVTASATPGYIATTMRTVSNSTYTEAERISSNGSYPTFLYFTSGGDSYWPIYLRYYVGLETNFAMPTTASSWSAGDTLYFRMFAKKGGSGNFKFHNGSDYNMTVIEVMR